MEKTTKMITAAVVLVLCAVAVIGVGYAYTATTVNSGNTTSDEYIVLSQDGDGAYRFTKANATIVYNTVNTAANTTTYTLADTTKTTINATEYNIRQVGKDITLKAVQTGAIKDKLTCTVTAKGTETANTGFLVISGYDTFIKIATKDDNDDDEVTWLKLSAANTFETLDDEAPTFTIYEGTGQNYKDCTVQVYFGYTGTPAPTNVPLGQPIVDATLEFAVTATPATA